jgi:hypothetical protein
MVDMRNLYEMLVGNLKGRCRLGDFVIGCRIILKWILNKCCPMMWMGFIWLRLGTSGGLL